MATTTADLIHSARRWLQSSGRGEHNKVTGSLTDSATTATLTYTPISVGPNAVLGVDLEEILVWANTGTSITAMQRGWGGSTAAAHAAGALVEVNPLFSSWRIFNELNAEIDSLSPQIYQVKTKTITATSASTYDLAADAVDILLVQTNAYGVSDDWPLLDRWAFLPNQDASVFATGKAIAFYAMPAPGRTIRVTYAAPLGTLSTLADDVETTTGMPASATDIPAIGAAARLLSAREARRSQVDQQPEPRQAQDVPPGTARSAAAQLFALRDRRIKEEIGKLSRLYPTRMRRAV